jgi:hypothetical protein
MTLFSLLFLASWLLFSAFVGLLRKFSISSNQIRRSFGNWLCFGTKSGAACDLFVEVSWFGYTGVRSSQLVAWGKSPDS